jgi:hypothetical protein
MNLNDDVVDRCRRLGPLHQRHPGRSRIIPAIPRDGWPRVRCAVAPRSPTQARAAQWRPRRQLGDHRSSPRRRRRGGRTARPPPSRRRAAPAPLDSSRRVVGDGRCRRSLQSANTSRESWTKTCGRGPWPCRPLVPGAGGAVRDVPVCQRPVGRTGEWRICFVAVHLHVVVAGPPPGTSEGIVPYT